MLSACTRGVASLWFCLCSGRTLDRPTCRLHRSRKKPKIVIPSAVSARGICFFLSFFGSLDLAAQALRPVLGVATLWFWLCNGRTLARTELRRDRPVAAPKLHSLRKNVLGIGTRLPPTPTRRPAPDKAEPKHSAHSPAPEPTSAPPQTNWSRSSKLQDNPSSPP
jgi:hypothetical protein